MINYNTIIFKFFKWSLFLTNDSERDYAISHEIFHAEDKSGELLSYSDYAWFIEGLACKYLLSIKY